MAMFPIVASRRESPSREARTFRAPGHPTACGAGVAIVLWSVLGMLLAQPCDAQVATETVTVIVNQDNAVDNLSLAELRDILSGQRGYWSPGHPVSLIVMPAPGTPERRIALSVVLGMTEASYKKHWVGRVFRAESASEPTTADSPEAAAQAVARTRGAIGLVAQAGPNVRVVRINGALPGDAAYPLRLAGGSSASATASRSASVELMYTPAVLQRALAIKGTLKLDKLNSFDALALVGASAEERRAYANKVAGATAVVIVGEDALKAASEVEFTVPVICVNAAGVAAARSKVIRVFDATTAPASARAAAAGDVAGLIAAGREVSLKGDVNSLVQAAVMALK